VKEETRNCFKFSKLVRDYQGEPAPES